MIHQLSRSLDQVNEVIAKLENESDIAKKSPQYSKTLAAYTELANNYQLRLNRLTPAILDAEIVVTEEPVVTSEKKVSKKKK